ncbi:MAG: substrate-binding domain-containing protein [Spirochaetes bacterium]|nr:substrate-binding domain-containing protein [Spirochaetota bacterium]
MRIAYIHAGMRFESYMGSHVYDEVCRGIKDAVKARDLVCEFFDARLNLDHFLRSKGYKRYAGLIGTIPTRLPAAKHWHRIEQMLPCVNLMIASPHPGSHFAGVDDAKGIRLVMEHLVSEGHERIGYFGIGDEEFSRKRFAAYLDFIRAHGLPVVPDSIVGFDPASGLARIGIIARNLFNFRSDRAAEKDMISRANEMLSRRDRPAALVFEADLPAIHFSLTARAVGVKIPGDIAITGFDNNRFYDVNDPHLKLTTVEQDFYANGTAAVKLLADIIDDSGMLDPRTVLTEPRLIVRRSSLKKSLRVSGGDDDFYETVGAYIDAHAGDHTLSHDLSRKLSMKHKYFLGKFAAVFGVTFVNYVNRLRLDKAAHRIRGTKDSITDILFDAGFRSHQNFNRQFKKHFGVSASDYRDGTPAQNRANGTPGKA